MLLGVAALEAPVTTTGAATASDLLDSFEDQEPVEGLGKRVPLTEEGYQRVGDLVDNTEMAHFIVRVVHHMNRQVVDYGGLSGFVPHYSGAIALQSLDRLKVELGNAPWTRAVTTTTTTTDVLQGALEAQQGLFLMRAARKAGEAAADRERVRALRGNKRAAGNTGDTASSVASTEEQSDRSMHQLSSRHTQRKHATFVLAFDPGADDAAQEEVMKLERPGKKACDAREEELRLLGKRSADEQVAHRRTIVFSPATAVNHTMEELIGTATDWLPSLRRRTCMKRIMKESWASAVTTCTTKCPLVWSKKFKFAYHKTPSSASKAFERHFFHQFPDAKFLKRGETLPADTFVFTFVRNPMDRVLSDYARVSLEAARNPSAKTNSSFQRVCRSEKQGSNRMLAYLRDVKAEQVQTSNGKRMLSQVAGLMCTKAKFVSYVGHLDNLEKDWRNIQILAKIPAEMRTTASTKVKPQHGQHPLFKMDTELQAEYRVIRKVCEMYMADFKCFGFDVPPACRAAAASLTEG